MRRPPRRDAACPRLCCDLGVPLDDVVAIAEKLCDVAPHSTRLAPACRHQAMRNALTPTARGPKSVNDGRILTPFRPSTRGHLSGVADKIPKSTKSFHHQSRAPSNGLRRRTRGSSDENGGLSWITAVIHDAEATSWPRACTHSVRFEQARSLRRPPRRDFDTAVADVSTPCHGSRRNTMLKAKRRFLTVTASLTRPTNQTQTHR